jgi:hypothetical protein
MRESLYGKICKKIVGVNLLWETRRKPLNGIGINEVTKMSTVNFIAELFLIYGQIVE